MRIQSPFPWGAHKGAGQETGTLSALIKWRAETYCHRAKYEELLSSEEELIYIPDLRNEKTSWRSTVSFGIIDVGFLRKNIHWNNCF